MNVSPDDVIKTAFQSAGEEHDIVERGQLSPNSGEYSINLSTIITKLIQETGRFCERYASDLLITWREIESFIFHPNPSDNFTNRVYAIGIRENGVDGNEYIAYEMEQSLSIDDHYRRIYGIRVSHRNNAVIVEMRDIKKEISYLSCRMKHMDYSAFHVKND